MSQNPEKKTGWLSRTLNTIERVGNSLPHPVTLFAIFALAVVVISAICAALGVSATGNLVSGGELKETTVTAVSLLTRTASGTCSPALSATSPPMRLWAWCWWLCWVSVWRRSPA